MNFIPQDIGDKYAKGHNNHHHQPKVGNFVVRFNMIDDIVGNDHCDEKADQPANPDSKG